jgi:hypothetical protein
MLKKREQLSGGATGIEVRQPHGDEAAVPAPLVWIEVRGPPSSTRPCRSEQGLLVLSRPILRVPRARFLEKFLPAWPRHFWSGLRAMHAVTQNGGPNHTPSLTSSRTALCAARNHVYQAPLHIHSRPYATYATRPSVVSRPTLVTAATTCIRANVPADHPVTPAKAIGRNERSRPTVATPQNMLIGRRVNRPMTANMAAAPTAPATLAPTTWPNVTTPRVG